jgi:hypothetical protein
VTIAGGGEKATFRIGGGYDHETGTMIKQVLNRLSTRVALDYNVSERIRVQTNFSMTYTKNDRNSDGLLDIARRKMPNMSIYEKDPVTGENTDRYYNMIETGPYAGSSVFDGNQKGMVNPVASANLAKNQQRNYDMNPELVINYNLLGLDDDHWRLEYRGSVYMNISNGYNDSFYPWELRSIRYNETGVNKSSTSSSKSVTFNTQQRLVLTPAFINKDHSLMVMGRFELNSGTSSSQSASVYGLPSSSGVIDSPWAGGIPESLSSNFNQWRSMRYAFQANYSYKGRYVALATLNISGTTKFGPGSRWGYFPAVSLK